VQSGVQIRSGTTTKPGKLLRFFKPHVGVARGSFGLNHNRLPSLCRAGKLPAEQRQMSMMKGPLRLTRSKSPRQSRYVLTNNNRYHFPDNLLYIDAHMRYVDRTVWISDDIIEISFHGMPAKYFVSPLRPVLEGERFDEVQVRDQVLLVGQYVVVVEAEEGGLGVVTNWLKITGMEQGAVSRRGMNRKREEAPARSVLR
jgi:hypothetical protein